MGLLGVIAGVIVLLAARRYAPGLANVLLFMIGACMVLLVLLVIAVLYFALRKPKKTEKQKADEPSL